MLINLGGGGGGDWAVNIQTLTEAYTRRGDQGCQHSQLTEADIGRGDQGCQQSYPLQRLIWGGEIRGVNNHTPYRG